MNETPIPTRFPATLSIMLVAALATILSACNPGDDSGQSGDGGTLRIAFFQDNPQLTSIDPFQVYWLEHRVVLRNVAESLTDQDPATGDIIPWLAKSWEVSDDGLQYTFHLRDDVTFSNGTPFDAHAVKTAFDSNKAFAESLPSTFGATYLAGYDRTEVIDAHTVRIVLERPNAGFLQAVSTTNLAILAPESYRLTAAQRSLGSIIGSGPFILERYTPEAGIRLTRREGYAWPSANADNRAEAHLAAVEISYVPEDSVRNGLFLQGRVDVLWPRNPFSEVDLRLLESRRATIHSRSLPGPAFNLYANVSEGKVLADPKVRKALQKAIDRESYAATVYSRGFPIVQSLYGVTTPYFKNQSDRLVHDRAGAQRLLDEAGWLTGDDGYRYKNGERLNLTLNLRTSETAGDVLIQDQLRQIGIALRLRVLTVGEWAAANAAGHYDLHENYMTRADPIVLQTFLDPRTAGNSALSVNVYTPEARDRALALFDAGLTATDPRQRARAYGDLQDLLLGENLLFPIYERVWQAATSERVQGFKWTSEGFAILGDIELVP